MALHNEVERLRERRKAVGGPVVPDTFQGVSKDRVRLVLRNLALDDKPDLVDAVFALLDDQTDSWFARAPDGAKFCAGASTAHVACHVGILQRGKGKLDREGRDYWIKPLRDLGGIEAVFLKRDTREFIPGHPVAKSSNSAYRLNEAFRAILLADDDQWPKLLAEWSKENVVRERKAYQAEVELASRGLIGSSHSDLIRASIEHYAAKFLPGYQVVYVDDGDGDRITEEDREALEAAGVGIELGDAMPDVLLWHPEVDKLWVIEAVTSDGEVDQHKFQQLSKFAERHNKAGIGFTTTYQTWNAVASRQGKHRNLAVGTYFWIQSEPDKQFLVSSFI